MTEIEIRIVTIVCRVFVYIRAKFNVSRLKTVIRYRFCANRVLNFKKNPFFEKWQFSKKSTNRFQQKLHLVLEKEILNQIPFISFRYVYAFDRGVQKCDFSTPIFYENFLTST